MDKIPYSFNANLLNDGTNLISWIPAEASTSPTARVVAIERPQRSPIYGGKILEDKTFPLNIYLRGTSPGQQFGTVSGWFDPTDYNTHKLVVLDAVNANKQWQVDATPISIPAFNGRTVTVTLEAANPVWESVTQNGGTITITASGQGGTITVGGNVNARPQIAITPTSAGGTGYAYKKWLPIYNNVSEALVNYPVVVTGSTINTATLVGAGKMRSDGNDLAINVDGVETPRWLWGMNSGTTSVWCNLNLNKKVEFVPGGTVAASGAVAFISIKNTVANKRSLDDLKTFSGGKGILLWGNEVFIFSSIDRSARKIYIQERASRGTTAAGHATTDTLRWIEHDIWLYYGNSTAEAPDQVDDTKPCIALDSTNASWIYSVFGDGANLRTGAWTPSILDTDNKRDPDYKSDYYTASRLTDADPYSQMGMTIQAFRNGSNWLADKASIAWQMYQPCGGTALTVTGEKYRTGTTWPSAKFKKSADGNKWTDVWTEATPASATTWTALAAHAAVSLSGTYNYFRFQLSGTQPATDSAQADYSIQTVTLTLDPAKIPTFAVGAEQSNYFLQGTIANTTTGKSITVQCGMALNVAITVDCDAKTVTLPDGTNGLSGLSLSSNRLDWLDLAPGANVLTFTDPGTNGLTLVVTWRDRAVD